MIISSSLSDTVYASVSLFLKYNSSPPPPPRFNGSNFQEVAHIQIIRGRPITIFAYFIFISYPPYPYRFECALVSCNAICGTMAGARQIETELTTNEFLVGILDLEEEFKGC